MDAAASPATGADGAGDESLALAAATDQLASLSVSKETVEDESENAKPTKDPDLWKPVPPPEDCPVCLIPLPMRNDESAYFPCCGKTICSACNEESTRAHILINSKRAKKEQPPVEESCAFCRTPYCDGDGYVKQCLLRMGKNYYEACFNLATIHHGDTDDGLPKDESKALELFLRAAELGSTKAMECLGDVYASGTMGVKKDMGKSREYFERAAKGGNLPARLFLANMDLDNNNPDLAIRHWKIAAEGGDALGMKLLWDLFNHRGLSKFELEEILRTHHIAINERKSEDRERYSSFQKAVEGGDKELTMLYLQYYEGIFTEQGTQGPPAP